MSSQKVFDVVSRKLRARYSDTNGSPPRWRTGVLVESNPSELAHVGEDQRALLLKENEMIMFTRNELGGSGPKFAGHAQVNAEPVVCRELEEHLFATSFRANQSAPRKGTFHSSGVYASEDAFVSMERNGGDDLIEAKVPLFAVEFDFGQFGHAGC